MKVVITGGHHNPAMPVISELRKRIKDVQIFWLGHRHTLINDKNDTLEYIEVTRLDIPFYQLEAGKVYKNFNLIRLIKVPFGFVQAFFYLLKLKPDIIISFGGYLAVPVVFAGYLLSIPSVTHEQTVVAGYANKFISKFAKKIFVSWPQSQKHFDVTKMVMSGLPIRTSISEVKSNKIALNPNLPTVYITGGKTGSHVLNLFVLKSLKELLNMCNVIHQCGDYSVTNDFVSLEDEHVLVKSVASGTYFLQKFFLEDEIGEVFAKSNLVVSRSGANTTAELLFLKKPCVLIPISWVSHNEQHENAKILCDVGLGTIVSEAELGTEIGKQKIFEAIRNFKQFSIKSNTNMFIDHPEKIIVDEIQNLVHN